jgi:alkanesulfonate monooxygenase SsuD/methylene tetrahydromethanopterin reductase-like flavin-dependent oxidoreductase (luciferase family)
VTPHSAAETAGIVEAIAARRASGSPVRVFADLVVFIDHTADAAVSRLRRLDDVAGGEFTSDAEVFTGTPQQLADLLQQWHAAGVAGFRLRPATLPHDLVQITDGLLPELQRRGVFRTSYSGHTLRDTLGLARPANRYSTAGTTT